MTGMPAFRGMVLPAAQPPGNAVRCSWGRCEAGGWILEAGWRVEDEHGGHYHPGCRAAMEYSNAHQDNGYRR